MARKAIFKVEAVIVVDLWDAEDFCEEHLSELSDLTQVTGLDYIDIADDVDVITVKETLIWEEAK